MVSRGKGSVEGVHRAFFELSSDGMAKLDADGCVCDVNGSALRLLDLGRAEILGRSFEVVLDPIHPTFEESKESWRATGSFDGDLLVSRSNGTCFTAEVSVRLGSSGGSFVFRSVGERERFGGDAKGEEDRFRALVHGTPDLVALVEGDGNIRYISPSVQRMCGYTVGEVEGRSLFHFVHPEDHVAAMKDLQWTAQNPGTVGLRGPVVRLRHRDGKWITVEAFVSNHMDDPSVGAMVFDCRDITERVDFEERLKASEGRYRSLVENAHDFIVLADENNVALYASPSIEATMGYTPEEFVGTVIAGYMHPDDVATALENVQETLPLPGPHVLDTLRYRRKDGSFCWLEVVVNNQMENPALRGVVCNCRDVTDRIEAEQQLRESEEFHRALSENALDFVVIQRSDNTLSYASPSVERLLGWTPEEVVGKMGADYIHPGDLEWAWPLFYEQIRNPGVGANEPTAIRYRHKNGSWRWFESACNNQLENPVIDGLVFNCRDITERVEAEEKLREAEEKYRLLVEQVPAATYIENNDADSSTVYISPRIEGMLGYAPEEWVAEPGLWLRTIHPEDHGRVLARHLGCNESGEPFDEEYRCIARDGREVWVRDEAVLLRNPAGEPLYWQGVKTDITGRKLAELEILRLNTKLRDEISGYTVELKDAINSLKDAEEYLEQREEQFLATFERAAVGMAHVSPDGRWLRVNQKLCEVVGYEREELLRRTFQDITHPEDLDADLGHTEKLLSGDIEDFSMEKRYVRGDGAVIWANLTVSLVRGMDGEPEYFISVIEDITRRKRTEKLERILTPREITILAELARGSTNSEIAANLNYSVNTIKAHIRSVTEKLDVADRTQAAVYAAEMGLIRNGSHVS